MAKRLESEMSPGGHTSVMYKQSSYEANHSQAGGFLEHKHQVKVMRDVVHVDYVDLKFVTESGQKSTPSWV